MVTLIIGNSIMFVASVLMSLIGLLKNKKLIIIIHTIEIAMMAIGNIMLGSITGAVVETISVGRNLMCYFGKMNKCSKIVLLILSTVVSLVFNNLGFVGLLPIAANIIFILFMNTQNVAHFKWLMIATLALWTSHDIYIQAYSVVLFDVITIVTNLVGIIMVRKREKQKESVRLISDELRV